MTPRVERIGLAVGSVCSGIGAPECAWHPLGWRNAFFSEIDPFPRAVLAHRFPGVPVHGDFTTIQAGQYDAIDLLVGGTPCQSFSVAGLRKGMADERGNLALQYLRLVDRLRPRWLVWENVPGVLSSNGGRDFGAFLGGLGELGYGFAYRVLDAQHFGVPQRRRRVFVVGHLGDWRPAAAVLFEPHSMRGHSAPRRKKGEAAAVCPTLRAGGNSTGGDRPPGTDVDTADSLIVAKSLRAQAQSSHREDSDNFVLARCVTTGEGKRQHYETCTLIADTITREANQTTGFIGDCVAHTLRAEDFDASEDGTGRGTPLVPCLTSNGDAHSWFRDEHGLVPSASAVRRLTPRECERLQGFPDDWTAVPYRNKPAADGPRYKALGNSMAVPVLRWIGERIQQQEAQRQGDLLRDRPRDHA
jgi:DNA (cytosine-5)-methyltransferase 1